MDTNDSRNSMSSKQERLIVCPKRKQSKWDDKNQNKVKVSAIFSNPSKRIVDV